MASLNLATADGLPLMDTVGSPSSDGMGYDQFDADNYGRLMADVVGATTTFRAIAFKYTINQWSNGLDLLLCGRTDQTTGNNYQLELWHNVANRRLDFRMWFGNANHVSVQTAANTFPADPVGRTFWAWVLLDLRYTGGSGAGGRLSVYEDGSSTELGNASWTAITGGAVNYSVNNKTKLGIGLEWSFARQPTGSDLELLELRHYDAAGFYGAGKRQGIADGTDMQEDELLGLYDGTSPAGELGGDHEWWGQP